MSEISRKILNADGTITVQDYADIIGAISDDAWLTWTPTITWATAAPVDVSAVCLYKIIGKTCFYAIFISSSNGNNATGMSMTLPATPKTNNAQPTASSFTKIGSTISAKLATVVDDGTNNKLQYEFMGTATAGSVFRAYLSGFYEIA